jgi:hypothetical protein
MLHVNTSLLLLRLPRFETADADERLRESRDQMRIEHLFIRAILYKFPCLISKEGVDEAGKVGST